MQSQELEQRIERAEKICEALRAEAAQLTDGFAEIAAQLLEEARRLAFTLETSHSLAARLDGAGVRAESDRLRSDLRRLLSAHVVFKRLSQDERDVRILFGLGAPVTTQPQGAS